MAQVRPVFSQAMSVEPEPPKKSTTSSPGRLLLRMARSHSAIGFGVAWPPASSLSAVFVIGKRHTSVIMSCSSLSLWVLSKKARSSIAAAFMFWYASDGLLRSFIT